MPVKFEVNGKPVEVEVEPRLTLADCLRHHLRLTGTHVGCEHGVCGACTVLVDGAAVRSCLMLAVQAEGAKVVTVEGLSLDEGLTPLQASFRKHHALQCGFCTPGMITTAHALLSEEPDCDADRVREVLSGNLCRCTGYISIVEAVLDARAAYKRDGNGHMRTVNAFIGQPDRAAGGLALPARPRPICRRSRAQGHAACGDPAQLRRAWPHPLDRRVAARENSRRACGHHRGRSRRCRFRLVPMRLQPLPEFEAVRAAGDGARQGALCRRGAGGGAGRQRRRRRGRARARSRSTSSRCRRSRTWQARGEKRNAAVRGQGHQSSR